ncbi:MAG: hypothetical protein LBO72_08345 [Helicobacteraceae bacterium]|jgi:alpha-tubulin suppressor-like RCC1 family protein|nr:hypothetical protein [Helicobacteraceae bacterium]
MPQNQSKNPRKPFAFLAALAAMFFAVDCAAASKNANRFSIVAAGEEHSFAIDEDGKLYATGHNFKGQLGFGDRTDRNAFMPVKSDKKIARIATSGDHSLALSSDGAVYAAGYNFSGQLGLGISGEEYQRKNDASIFRFFFRRKEQADRLGFTRVKSLRGKTIVAVATGDHYSLALDSDGKLYAAGDIGRLGLGDTACRDPFSLIPPYCDTFTLIPPFSDKKIVAIAAGDHHSLALDIDGKIYAIGSNNEGQLGLGDTSPRKTWTPVPPFSDRKIVAIAGSWSHSLALDENCKVYATGFNGNGKLGLGDRANRASFALVSSLADKKIVAIAAGYQYSLAIDANGAVYATGDNEYGRLGLGDTDERKTWTLVSSLEGRKIVAIAAGYFHSLALDTDGKIYAAGRNFVGQLGLSDAKDRNVFTPVILSDR